MKIPFSLLACCLTLVFAPRGDACDVGSTPLALAAPDARVEPHAANGPAAKKGATVVWRKKKHQVDALPEDMPAPAQEAVRMWADWCVEHDLHASLNDDGRVLLLTSARGRADKRLALVERTAKHVDAILPLPASRTAPPGGQAPAGDAGGDTDGAAGASDRSQDEGGGSTGSRSWSWVDDGGPLETETAVIFELDTRADQAKVVEHLRESYPYLADFDASGLAGFSLERPLVAAWLAAEPENEEWNPDAELVHRTATLLFLRRFGRQPFWLQTGVAWQVEQALCGGVWCFPYRAEFVFAVEHTGWPERLAALFSGRDKRAFDVAVVANWKRGTFRADEALMAWGVAAWFASERPGVLSEVLEDLRRHRDANDRMETGEHSWQRIPGWEVPVEVQRETFERHTSPRLWTELTQAFERAKSAPWSKPKPRG